MRILLFIVVYPVITHSFPPSAITGNAALTRHHEELTRHGITFAVSTFLKENNLTESTNNDPYALVDEFFDDDNDGKEEYLKRRDEVITIVKEQEKSKNAYIHCNSELFEISHSHIQKLRKQIKDLAETPGPDLGLIREMIGQCIYTIQAFYSTSNWIEMQTPLNSNIPETYRDFGMPGKTLMAIAEQNEHTCSNCDNSGNDENSCKNNLLVTDKLTSGYQTDEDVQPPIKTDPSITTGKCGFGGSSDTKNGLRTATGGINKDRTVSHYSPHHHLHSYAAIAARTATQQFLVDPEIGIINELQKDMFAKVFNLNKRYKASFGFVIDVTGSMSNNIAQVTSASVDIITNVLNTENEPEDYVLTTFSDPQDLTQLVKKTTDGLQMIPTLRSLTVSGGGDCPEFTMDGIMKCIPDCKENSKLYIFTDAPAKDESRRDEMINAAKDKNIIPIFFLQDDMCTARKKRSIGREKRSTGADFFMEIAAATGGRVYQISTAELADVIKEVTEELFPSSTAVIDFFELSSTTGDDIQFPVDESCKNFKVTINGAGSTGEVDLLSTTGSIILDSNTKLLFQSPSNVVVTVVNPLPDLYTIRRLVKNNWSVNITAQTAVDFSYKILEEDSEGYMYRLSGNPILGKTYAIFITPYNIPENSTVDGIVLTSSIESDYNLTNVASGYETTYFVMATLTEAAYKLTILGHVDNGNYWKRTSPFTINPVSVQLEMKSSVPDLYVGSIINVTYTVQNMGSQNVTLVTTVSDNRGLIVGDASFTTTLSHGASEEVLFQLQGSSSYKTVSYQISVRKIGEVTILQQARKTIYISPDTPPTCSVETIDGYCGDITSGGNVSCSDVKWTGKTTVTYSSEISSLAGTIGLVVHYDNFSSSPIEVFVRGDCCTPSSYLTVIDKNNNFARCHFFLGEVQYKPESKPALSTVEKIAIGMIGGIVAAVVVVLVVIGCITYRAGVKPKLDKLKVDAFNINTAKDLPVKNDNISKSSPYVNSPPVDTVLPWKRIGDLEILDIE